MEEFIAQYSEAIVLIVVGVAYEFIANSKLQSNSIFQLVKNVFKSLINKLEKK